MTGSAGPQRPASTARRVAAVLAAVLALVAGTACARSVDGTARYASGPPGADLPVVKIAQLPDLIPTAAEARDLIDAPTLLYLVEYRKPDSLPADTLSEPDCASAIIPNDQATYAGSGYAGVYGRLGDDFRSHRISAGVAAFGSAEDAHRFATDQVGRWEQCTDRTLTVSVNDRQIGWSVSGPNRADGTDVLVRRQQDVEYACSRGVASRSNVVADVLVCGRDAGAVGAQAGKLANVMLAKIPE